MNHLVPALFILFFPICLFGQDTTTTSSIAPEKGKHRGEQVLVDLNWNHLLNLDKSIDQEFYSRGINIYGMYDLPINKNGNVSFAIGAGFSSQNYFTDASIKQFDSLGTQYSEFAVDPTKKRGKLSTNFVDVPIEFRFRTNENKHGHRFKIALGGKVGYLVNVHEKYINHQDQKFKFYDFPDVNDIRYGVVGRIGYGRVMLSGFYSISSLFDDAHSTREVQPLAIGITIVPF